MESHVREGRGDDLQHLEVPARGDFQLDAREPGVDRFLDVSEEHVVGILDAEVGAGGHVPRLSAEQPVQRRPGDAALQRPPADLDGGLGEAVPLEDPQPLVEVGRGVELAPDHPRPHHFGDVVEDGAGALGEIGRREEGGALRPGGVPAAGKLYEHGVDVGVLAVGGAPGIDQRHYRVVHVESVDLHLRAPVFSAGAAPGIPPLHESQTRRLEAAIRRVPCGQPIKGFSRAGSSAWTDPHRGARGRKELLDLGPGLSGIIPCAPGLRALPDPETK